MKRSAIVLCAILGALLMLDISNFCYSKGRWLSDNELMRIAMLRGFQRNSLEDRYKDVADFLQQNKNCCVLDRARNEGPMPAFGQIYVEIFYDLRGKKSDGEAFYHEYMGLTACGGPGAWWATDDPETARPKNARSVSE